MQAEGDISQSGASSYDDVFGRPINDNGREPFQIDHNGAILPSETICDVAVLYTYKV
jgi:hypothetical protein